MVIALTPVVSRVRHASFQLPKSSKTGELHFPSWGQVADFSSEADFPPNRWAVVNDELSEAVQLEVVPILVQMRYEGILQAGFEHSEECLRFVLRVQSQRSLKTFNKVLFSTFPTRLH